MALIQETNMDFTKFLNSKDIAEHLRKINYVFSPEEALYVIQRSRNATLSEKRAAFRELLAQYPAYRLRERKFDAFKGHTLESFLHELFQKQDDLIAACKQNSGDAFFSLRTYNSAEGWNGDDRRKFSSFEACFSAAQEEEGMEKFEIVKQYLSGHVISLTVLPDGTVLGVETSESDDVVLDAFDMLYIEIPTPFHFGDIVKSVREKVWDATFHKPYEDMTVLTCIAHWDRETASSCDLREAWGSLDRYFANEKLRARHLESGDETDMLYSGYSLTEHGLVCDHSVWDTYLDLEYCREDLTGRGRILKAVSLYFQRKMNLETLLSAMKAIEAEETKRVLWETSLQGYEEEMKQIGIKGEKQ